MATQLKNIVRFTNVAAGATVALPHGLAWSPPGGGEIPQIPDACWPSRQGFTVTADATNVTVTNNTAQVASIDVLAELWHSLERAFGNAAIEELTPRPFVQDLGNAGDAAAAVIGFGTKFLNEAATSGEGSPDILFPWNGDGTPPTGLPLLEMAAPRAGTLRNLFVRHNTPLGAQEPVTYTVLVNGAPTALTVVVPGAAEEAALLAVDVLVAQGDDIAMQAEHGILSGEGLNQADVVATMVFAD